jgi:hypothetical protein
MNFEALLVQTVRDLRERLASEDISSMRLDIEVTGRVHDGDVLIVFKLGEQYDGGNASGDSIEAVTAEFLRRKAWKARHENLRISHSGEPEL